MTNPTNQNYLRDDQYKNATNLNARIELHRRFSTNKYSFQCWVFDQFDLPENSRVLELGSGPGSLWLGNLDRIPPSWQITLSDFSAGMVEEQRQNLANSSHPFNFEQIEAQSLPFENASLDAVIANHMLYHVPDRPKAFSEIQRVLKPTGRFFAATNGKDHLKEFSELITKFDPALHYDFANSSSGFSLENGVAQLSPYFSSVELSFYDDNLVATEAEPMVNYILSTITARRVLVSDKLSEFRQFLEQEIAEHGSIFLTKSTGLFICSNEPGRGVSGS